MIRVHKININLESGRVIRLQNQKEFDVFLSNAFGLKHKEDFDLTPVGKKLKIKNRTNSGYYPFTYELVERYYVTDSVVRAYADLIG